MDIDNLPTSLLLGSLYQNLNWKPKNNNIKDVDEHVHDDLSVKQQ